MRNSGSPTIPTAMLSVALVALSLAGCATSASAPGLAAAPPAAPTAAAQAATRPPTADRRRAAAGIGGCPHAPGASGNVATEDVAYLFASMGQATGVDFGRLLALRSKVAAWLAGEALHGSIARAGLPKTMAAR